MVTGSSHAKSQARELSQAAQAAEAWLRQLARTLKVYRLYQRDNPIVVHAHDQVLHVLEDVVSGRADVTTLLRGREQGVLQSRSASRVTPVVRTDNGETVEAITYAALKVGEGLMPTREYLGHLLAGKDLLPADYCERLGATPTID